MKVLITGPESSGTKLVASLLRGAGAEVTHSSPNYRREQGKFPHKASDYDAVIIVIRNWYAQNHSMVDAGHTSNLSRARRLVYQGLSDILYGLSYGAEATGVYLITLESLIYEPDSLRQLLRQLGLKETSSAGGHEIGNPNSKYYNLGSYFRDDRPLHER